MPNLTFKWVKKILSAIFWSILGLACLGFFFYSLYLNHCYATESMHVVGTVIEKHANHGTKGRMHYHVTYRFKDTEGNVHREYATVEGATYDDLAPGGPVHVKYLSRDHSYVRIDTTAEDFEVVLEICAAAGAAVFCAVILYSIVVLS